MTTATAPLNFIKLLAHDVRWGLLKALTVSDLRVQELSSLVNEPMNLVSYHLKKMRQDDLVTTRRSEADGRDLYYSLDVGKLRMLYQQAGHALHPVMSTILPFEPAVTVAHPLRILFVCTHNAARSQMAEALLRNNGSENIAVFSAGNAPTEIHPDTVSTMQALGIPLTGQYAKSLEQFNGQSFDYVITVCDRARETCPTFPGGQQLHWGFADPLNIQNETERRTAFEQIAAQLASRIEYFLTEQQA